MAQKPPSGQGWPVSQASPESRFPSPQRGRGAASAEAADEVGATEEAEETWVATDAVDE